MRTLFSTHTRSIRFVADAALRCGLVLIVVAAQVLTVDAQQLRVVCDGRTEAPHNAPSAADARILQSVVLPAARRSRFRDSCDEWFEAVAITTGAFLEPGTSHATYLYRYCTKGFALGVNGVVVMDGNRPAAHVMYDGGSEWSIGVAEDVNGNGTSEVVLYNSEQHQGMAFWGATVIDISGGHVTPFGYFDLGEENDGMAARVRRRLAYRILVAGGASPVFYRESYRWQGGRWVPHGKATPFTPQKAHAEFQVL